ncbi:MAG: carotenoid biosynthesis protein [Bacteroidota bacterium]
MSNTRTNVAIAILWLFHLSGIIGMLLGYSEWFLSKTPLNLIICLMLLAWVGDLLSNRKAVLASIFFVSGMLVEWVGVKFAVPFGEYYYGESLGTKLDGVPFLIGGNWAMLVIITGCISSRISGNFLVKVLLGAGLMVLLDLFIEPNAANFDFWFWENETIPLSNYIAWFVISALLHCIYQKNMPKQNFRFCLHLYLAQLAFFTSFYVYPFL